MLKWLVTKSASNPPSLQGSVTDDPLATLARRGSPREPIYAVSRINPIFEEDGKDFESTNIEIHDSENLTQKTQDENHPESPGTDRESIRSSGYGSKEADGESVSLSSDFQEENPSQIAQEDNVDSSHSSNNKVIVNDQESKGNFAEIKKSFENLCNNSQVTEVIPVRPPRRVTIVSKNPDYVKDIDLPQLLEVIPEVSQEVEAASTVSKKSSWSKINHLAQVLNKGSTRIYSKRERNKLKKIGKEYEIGLGKESTSKSQVLRFHPLVSVVAQNEHYVTSISLSPNRKAQGDIGNVIRQCDKDRRIPDEKITVFNSDTQAERCSSTRYFSHRYAKDAYPLLTFQPDSLVNEETLKMMNYPDHQMYEETYPSLEENFQLNSIPNFSKALYSGSYPSISNSSSSQDSQSRRVPNYASRYNTKKRGINVVKDLWEKTGLRTNGRKLIVDVSDHISDDIPGTHSRILSYGSRKSSLHGNSSSIDDLRSYTNSNNTNYINNGSSSTHSYEEIPDSYRGINNVAFIGDKELSKGSTHSSYHSRSSHPFQHSLTEFQKRVSERLRGEPNHRTTWIDIEKGENGEITEKYVDSNLENRHDRNSTSYSDKVIKHLGLGESANRTEAATLYKGRFYSGEIPWNSSSGANVNTNPSGSFGRSNRVQIWDKLRGYQKKGTFSSYFRPHPNSEAPMFAHSTDIHDFTLDPKRSHRLLESSTRIKRRRKCCIWAIVLLGLSVFVFLIIGISLYSTHGERYFGPL